MIIREEYTSPRDWTIFPYLYENLKYSHEAVFHYSGFIKINRIKLNAPHLLLEFMEANAFPESLELIKYMLNLSENKKTVMSKAQENPSLHFIDSLTTIIWQQPPNSPEKEEKRVELMWDLTNATFDSTLTQSERNKVEKTLEKVIRKKKMYETSNSYIKTGIKNIDISVLDKKLRAFEDSIELIKNDLIEIVENKKRTNKTKEKATVLLVKIHTPEVLEYVFKNEEQLCFGKFNSDDWNPLKTALIALCNEYAFKQDWVIFPYLYQYIKHSHDMRSFALVHVLLGYNDPLNARWLASEFMKEKCCS